MHVKNAVNVIHIEDLKSLRGEAEGSISQREMGMMIKKCGCYVDEPDVKSEWFLQCQLKMTRLVL